MSDTNSTPTYRLNMKTGRIAQSGNIPAHGEEAS